MMFSKHYFSDHILYVMKQFLIPFLKDEKKEAFLCKL